MAFNQATFILFPPKFWPSVEVDNSNSEPVSIVSSVPSDPHGQEVLTAELREWLFAKDFAERERYGGCQVLFRGRVETRHGTLELIDLKLPLEESEISGLTIRFLLTESTPDSIPEWTDLISELGSDFGFRILDDENNLLPGTDFLTALRQNRNFCQYQEHYGWQV